MNDACVIVYIYCGSMAVAVLFWSVTVCNSKRAGSCVGKKLRVEVHGGLKDILRRRGSGLVEEEEEDEEVR